MTLTSGDPHRQLQDCSAFNPRHTAPAALIIYYLAAANEEVLLLRRHLLLYLDTTARSTDDYYRGLWHRNQPTPSPAPTADPDLSDTLLGDNIFSINNIGIECVIINKASSGTLGNPSKK